MAQPAPAPQTMTGPKLAVDNVLQPTHDAITDEINFYARLHKGERPDSWPIDPALVEPLAREIYALACLTPAKNNGLQLADIVAMVTAGGCRIRAVQIVVKSPA